MNQLPVTPSQTVGPFFAYGLTARQYGYDYSSLISNNLGGVRLEPIEIVGRVFDGQNTVVSDALIELWQADPAGRYRSEAISYPDQADSFTGIGRFGTGTTSDFGYTFTTCKPGRTGTGTAPHINVILFMRGSLRTLYTRLYFPDEAEANADDELLNSVPEERRHTLVATRPSSGRYQFDIHMQGANETVFFAL